ncbi:MAG: hypothetical protein JSW40_04070, partial [Candidatus Omnitrophota bacterium]
MKKRRIGLYLGVNCVGGVIVDNRRVVSLTKFDLSSLENEAKVETLSEGVRWEALINKTLRQMQAEEKEVYVSVADKDFIFRSFDIPLMRKEEVESSIVYEVEKYVPFKLRELLWDYNFVRSPQEKKMVVSFLGIRESSFKRFRGTFVHLDISPLVIEPASLSLVRMIKGKGKCKTKNFALLDLTDIEAYLTFYYGDLPIFNRYLTVPKKEEEVEHDKLIESMRLSFQYFKREFRSYKIEKFIIISDTAQENLLSFLQEESQANVETISSHELVDRPNSTIETLKAFGATARDYYPSVFTPVLRSTEERGAVIEKHEGVPLRMGLLAALVGVGFVLSVLLSMYFGNEISVKKVKLRRQEEAIEIPSVFQGFPVASIRKKVEETEKKIS